MSKAQELIAEIEAAVEVCEANNSDEDVDRLDAALTAAAELVGLDTDAYDGQVSQAAYKAFAHPFGPFDPDRVIDILKEWEREHQMGLMVPLTVEQIVG